MSNATVDAGLIDMSNELGRVAKNGRSSGDEDRHRDVESPVDPQKIVPNNEISPRPFTSDAANNYYNAMTKRNILSAPSKDRKKKGLMGKIKWKGGNKGKKVKADDDDKVQMEVINEGDESDDCSDVNGRSIGGNVQRGCKGNENNTGGSGNSDTVNEAKGDNIINDSGDYQERRINATKTKGDSKNYEIDATGRTGNESAFSETTSDGDNGIVSNDVCSAEPSSQPPLQQDSLQILQGGREAKNCQSKDPSVSPQTAIGEDSSDRSIKSNRSTTTSKSKRSVKLAMTTGLSSCSAKENCNNEPNKPSLEDRNSNAPHSSLNEETSVRSTKSNQSASGSETSKRSARSAKSSPSGGRPPVRGQTALSSDVTSVCSIKSSGTGEPGAMARGDRSNHVIQAAQGRDSSDRSTKSNRLENAKASSYEKSHACNKWKKAVSRDGNNPQVDQGIDSCDHSTKSNRSAMSNISLLSKRSINSVKSGSSNERKGVRQSIASSVRSARSKGSRSIKSSRSSSGQKLPHNQAMSPIDAVCHGKTSSSATGHTNSDLSSGENVIISCDSCNGGMEVELSISNGENDHMSTKKENSSAITGDVPSKKGNLMKAISQKLSFNKSIGNNDGIGNKIDGAKRGSIRNGDEAPMEGDSIGELNDCHKSRASKARSHKTDGSKAGKSGSSNWIDEKEGNFDSKCEVVKVNASNASAGKEGNASAVSRKGLEQLLTEALAMSLTPEGIAQYLMDKGGSTAIDEFLLITGKSNDNLKGEDRDGSIPPVTSFEKADVLSAASSVTQNTGHSGCCNNEGEVNQGTSVGKAGKDTSMVKKISAVSRPVGDEEDIMCTHHEKDDMKTKDSDASTAASSNPSSEEGDGKKDHSHNMARTGAISTLRKLKKKSKGEGDNDTEQGNDPTNGKSVKRFEPPTEADPLTPPHAEKHRPIGKLGHGAGGGGGFDFENNTESEGKTKKSALSKLKGKLKLSSNGEGERKKDKGWSSKVNTLALMANSEEETNHATSNMMLPLTKTTETGADASLRSAITTEDEATQLIDPSLLKNAPAEAWPGTAADGTAGEGGGQEIHPSFACGMFEAVSEVENEFRQSVRKMFGVFSPTKPAGGEKLSIPPVSSFEQPLKEGPLSGPASNISDSGHSEKLKEDNISEKCKRICGGVDDSSVISWKDLDQTGLCA